MSGKAQQPGGKTWATTLLDAGSWQSLAACQLADSERFTCDTRPPEAELRALADICGGCGVTAECARFALQNRLCGFFAGVWVADGGREVLPARTALRHKAPMSEMDHGKEAGAKAHRRRGEQPCGPCREAAARASRLRHQEIRKARHG